MYHSYLKSGRGSLLGCLHGKHLHLVLLCFFVVHVHVSKENKKMDRRVGWSKFYPDLWIFFTLQDPLEHANFHIIRHNVQFHLGDHLANGTTFAKSLGWSV